MGGAVGVLDGAKSRQDRVVLDEEGVGVGEDWCHDGFVEDFVDVCLTEAVALEFHDFEDFFGVGEDSAYDSSGLFSCAILETRKLVRGPGYYVVGLKHSA